MAPVDRRDINDSRRSTRRPSIRVKYLVSRSFGVAALFCDAGPRGEARIEDDGRTDS